MSTSGIAKASKVDRAFERLEAAVDRLDVAMSKNSAGVPDAAEEDAVLRLRQENAELKELNRTAADRLSGIIARLDQLSTEKSEG